MKNIFTISIYTLREAFARKVFIFFAVISIIFLIGLILIFSFIKTDSILSSINPTESGLIMGEVVSKIQLLITSPLSNLCLLLAIFSTASFVPIMLEKGNIDLLLSKPISRTQLLLGKYIGGTLIVFINIAFLIIGAWIIISVKFSHWNFNFLLVILVITFTFAVLFSVVVLFGILSRSSVPGMMIAYFIFLILSPVLLFFKSQLRTFTDSEILKTIIDGLYYVVPKTSELMGTVNSSVSEGKSIVDYQPILSSFLFLIIILFLCDYIFKKKDF
jgi:ABC-type transport system involved in multi-copper enzyme maturation permease subunit